MLKIFETALFIFRRDLRIQDNSGLLYALKNAKRVFCAFIFTQQQINKNSYRSDFCLQFMLDSLQDLDEDLRSNGGQLFYFFDEPENVVEKCIHQLKVDLVSVNRDYTPYSTQRDALIEKVCLKNGITFKSFDDLLLHAPDNLLKSNGKPYTVFTPFYRNAMKLPVAFPTSNSYTNYAKTPIEFSLTSSFFSKILPQRRQAPRGGRKEALEILKNLFYLSYYDTERDYPIKDATSHLSPHLKFTTVSPREVYAAISAVFGPYSALIRSLYWRDFFSCIAFHFPHVFKGAFHSKFDALVWENHPLNFKRWCEGTTGFPIVDAGMRQLNATGLMHNRVRMITASFLVKDLHISWQNGEKYFAQHLVDYDPAVNNGNWQWAASTGCDAQPYFRIFNPWAQQIKFDSECAYIKEWIPELRQENSTTIHHWAQEQKSSNYPLPMIDHSRETKKTLEHYKQCTKAFHSNF